MSHIRAYGKEDDDAIIAVWEAASRVAHPFLSVAFIEKEKHAIREIYLPNTETVIAEEGGDVVGFASTMGDELGAIFLEPDFHGKGIGKALLDAAANGRDFLDVEVFEKNAIGRAFYQRSGFKEIKRSRHEETGEALIRLRWRRDGAPAVDG